MPNLQDLQDLPPLAEDAFLAVEALCREDMRAKLSLLGPNDYDGEYLVEYMSRVQAAAYELGIDQAEALGDLGLVLEPDHYRWFNQEVLKIITRLQLRSVRRNAENSLELEPADRSKLKAEVARLRNRVQTAEGLDEKHRAAIQKKVDALLGEIDRPRINLSQLALALAAVTAAITAVDKGESALIKGPEAIVAVLDMIHMARGKEKERRAVLEYYRKPRFIEHRPEAAENEAKEQFSADLDDEIPF